MQARDEWANAWGPISRRQESASKETNVREGQDKKVVEERAATPRGMTIDRIDEREKAVSPIFFKCEFGSKEIAGHSAAFKMQESLIDLTELGIQARLGTAVQRGKRGGVERIPPQTIDRRK
jgi:hypothetical protein